MLHFLAQLVGRIRQRFLHPAQIRHISMLRQLGFQAAGQALEFARHPPGSPRRLRQPLRPEHHQRHQCRQQHLAEREIKHRLFARLLFFVFNNLLGRSRFALALAAFV